MSTGRNSCPPAWETALLHLVSCQNLQPLPLCNAANNLVGYVAVVHDCQTGTVTPIYLDTNFVKVSALAAGFRPCQSNVQINAGDINFTPLFQTIEPVCVQLPGTTTTTEAHRITVRDASNKILAQTLEDIATQQPITVPVVEFPC